MHLHGKRLAADARNWGDVPKEVIIELFEQRRVDGIPERGQEQCMAIRWCVYDGFGGDIATSSRPILDDEGGAGQTGQPIPPVVGFQASPMRLSFRVPDAIFDNDQRVDSIAAVIFQFNYQGQEKMQRLQNITLKK